MAMVALLARRYQLQDMMTAGKRRSPRQAEDFVARKSIQRTIKLLNKERIRTEKELQVRVEKSAAPESGLRSGSHDAIDALH